MKLNKKTAKIDLPLSLTLTDEGKYFFNSRPAGGPGGKEYRFIGDTLRLDTYSAKTLQRLVYAGYVSDIETARTNFTSKRSELMDVSKLIAYGVLYKKFAMTVGRELNDNNVVVSWNRRNPHKALNEETIINSGNQMARIRDNELLQGIKRHVADTSVEELLSGDAKVSSEEREVTRYKAEYFLESINPLLWMLLARVKDTHDYAVTIAHIREILRTYLERTSIADYLSLLLIELVTVTETTLVKKGVGKYYDEHIDPRELMMNQEVRDFILRKMEEENYSALLAWRIQGKKSGFSGANPLQILLYNRILESEAVKRDIEEKKSVQTKGKGLADFYAGSSRNGEDENGLGMFYLTYLQEVCRDQGVRFDSYVNDLSEHDLTLINLAVKF
jgi:hypothetical protein